MKIKYCLPVIKRSKEEVLQKILQGAEYDFFEVWLDYIKDLDEAFVRSLIDQLGGRLIIVLRRQNLKTMKLSLEVRLNIITLMENSQPLLDLDVFGQREELEYIKNNQLEVKTIVSYHNYQQTPDDGKLKEIIDTMKVYNPLVFKIATLCNVPTDGLRLLGLLLAIKEKNTKCIILGMGEFGIITRIFGGLWGNEFNFAPVDLKEKSAKGQLTKSQLENILKEIK